MEKILPLERMDVRRWLGSLQEPQKSLSMSSNKKVPGYCEFANSWRVDTDGIGEHLLYYVIKGEFEATVGGSTYRCIPHDLLWLSPDTPFVYQKVNENALAFYRFRLSLETGNCRLGIEPRVIKVSNIRSAISLFEQIVYDIDFPDAYSRWRLRGLLLALCSDVLETKQQKQNDSIRRLTRAQMRKLKHYFHNNHRVWPTPADFAEQIGLSPHYFTQLFTASFGMSPRKWITRERIIIAQDQLLESNCNISELAADLGYRNVYFFSRQFKEVMGMSPSRYRN
ncbi:AraC family transcriptional regulator [Rubellicoccus peritrichatus]|uniref:AraC family transcriptional regulator n=1 Tax=Rubellicoccus peritrichatus TaxID=3080537 RepID=A0AAQ3LGV1_9BACT|nr:AraC family transcriptional regulator [Puniceicoccus sp. CR14]WOO43573.1 AraC family transcriptional regulator [Puniceicoccus sp. CR14]